MYILSALLHDYFTLKVLSLKDNGEQEGKSLRLCLNGQCDGEFIFSVNQQLQGLSIEEAVGSTGVLQVRATSQVMSTLDRRLLINIPFQLAPCHLGFQTRWGNGVSKVSAV